MNFAQIPWFFKNPWNLWVSYTYQSVLDILLSLLDNLLILPGDTPPRYEMLQDNVKGYRKEIASLMEKGQKMAAAAQTCEQTVHTMTQDLRVAQEKLNMAEVCVPSILFIVLEKKTILGLTLVMCVLVVFLYMYYI